MLTDLNNRSETRNKTKFECFFLYILSIDFGEHFDTTDTLSLCIESNLSQDRTMFLQLTEEKGYFILSNPFRQILFFLVNDKERLNISP